MATKENSITTPLNSGSITVKDRHQVDMGFVVISIVSVAYLFNVTVSTVLHMYSFWLLTILYGSSVSEIEGYQKVYQYWQSRRNAR